MEEGLADHGGELWGFPRLLAAALFGTACGVFLLMLVAKTAGLSLPCSGERDCIVLALSLQAGLFGVPLEILGLTASMALLVLTVVSSESRSFTLKCLAGGAGVAAIVGLSKQIIVSGASTPYWLLCSACLAVAAMAVLVPSRVPRGGLLVGAAGASLPFVMLPLLPNSNAGTASALPRALLVEDAMASPKVEVIVGSPLCGHCVREAMDALRLKAMHKTAKSFVFLPIRMSQSAKEEALCARFLGAFDRGSLDDVRQYIGHASIDELLAAVSHQPSGEPAALDRVRRGWAAASKLRLTQVPAKYECDERSCVPVQAALP